MERKNSLLTEKKSLTEPDSEDVQSSVTGWGEGKWGTEERWGTERGERKDKREMR